MVKRKENVRYAILTLGMREKGEWTVRGEAGFHQREEATVKGIKAPTDPPHNHSGECLTSRGVVEFIGIG